MKVLKFGGTSVGSPLRMKKVGELITADREDKIVVLSAVSGTTNKLVDIALLGSQESVEEALQRVELLRTEYDGFIQGLFDSTATRKEAEEYLSAVIDELSDTVRNKQRLEWEVPAFGELISTRLFHLYLLEKGVAAALIPALEFMRLDENGEPDLSLIRKRLNLLLKQFGKQNIYITQGYICRNSAGEIDNLQRGGSDYTASLIGAAIKAAEIQIWTDIDGMHNNDPRVVRDTYPISNLSFDEAAELAYFGAKILHPATIRPAQKFQIPVRLKSTMDHEASGTLIHDVSEAGKVKAIAAKDGITAIKIKSSRMLLAYGFLRKVFEVFERLRTSIDMITTSEVAVSLTVDDDSRLADIKSELEKYAYIEVDREQTIICIVGYRITEDHGVLMKIFKALTEVPIRMVSYGGSRNNISLLIDSRHKSDALQNLNRALF